MPKATPIAVIGTGYVGLTTGACLAGLGHNVVCVDVDAAKVKQLRAGRIPILEDGLEELVRENVAAGRLRFSQDTPQAVQDSSVVVLCVPTPQSDDGTADLTYL